jgi:hypothetical protein
MPVSPFIHVNFVREVFHDRDLDPIEPTIEVYRHFGFDLMHRNMQEIHATCRPFGHLPYALCQELVGDKGIVAPLIQGVFNEVNLGYRRLDELIPVAVLQPGFYHDLV